MTPVRIADQLLRPRPAGWTMLVLAMVFPAVAAYVYFVRLSGTPHMTNTYAAAKVLQFGLPVAWLLLLHQWQFWVRRPHIAGVGSALVFGLLAGIAIVVAYGAALRHTPLFGDFPELLHAKLQGLHADTPMRFLGLAAFISVVHSFLEEFYWRWFVCGHMAWHTGRRWAVALSSIAFTAHHVIVLACYLPEGAYGLVALFSLPVLLGGAFWAWHYTRHQSLVAVWISHMLVDIALMSVGYTAVWG